MSNSSSDALRDALTTLANDLDPLIDDAQQRGDMVANEQLTMAQNDLVDAASRIDALSVSAILTNNQDLQKLQTLTSEIATKADDITGQQANVARIVGIATGVVSLATALESGNVAAAIKAVGNIQGILD